jgi:hypothetical protein
VLFFLVKNKLLSVYNNFFHSSQRMVRGKILGYALLLVVPVFIYTNTRHIFSLWRVVPGVGERFIWHFLSLSLLGILVFLTVSSVTIGLHYFFLSKDLPDLLKLPMRFSTLFTFKFLETSIASSAIFLILGGPLVIAAGVASHAPVLYYVIGFCASVVFLFIPTGLAFVLSIAMIRFLPPKRARSIATLFMGLLSVSLWIGFQFLKLHQLEPIQPDFSPAALDRLQAVAGGGLLAWAPSQWLTTILYGLANNYYEMLVHGALLVMLCLALWLLGNSFYSWAYRHDFIAAGAFLSPLLFREKNRRSSCKKLYVSQALVPFRALLQKEKYTFFRDPRQFTQLAFYLAIMIVFPLLLQRDESDARLFGESFPFAEVILLGCVIACSLAARSVPMEGRAFHLALISPQKPRSHLMAKTAFALTVTFLLFTISLLVLAVRYNPSLRQMAQTFLTGIFSFGASAVIGLYLGVFFARFDWDNPKRMLHGIGNSLVLVAPVVFWVGGATFLFIGFYTGFYGFAFFLYALYSAAVIIVGTILAERKLSSLEWMF